MHTRDASQGRRERGAHPSPAGLARVASLYGARTTALAWTEAITQLPETGAADDVYAEVAARFSGPEIANLTLAIGAISLWNRFGVGFRLVHPHKRSWRRREPGDLGRMGVARVLRRSRPPGLASHSPCPHPLQDTADAGNG